MNEALGHPQERYRLEALRDLAILDTPPEQEFDDLTLLAAQICGVPISLVSLIDADRQWFKSKQGIAIDETTRDVSICAHAILQDELFVVPDTRGDARFKDNPHVLAEPGVRFYAGMPLALKCGLNVGTLCVVDSVPRDLTSQQMTALRVLARQVMAQIALRKQKAELERELAERRRIEAELRSSEEKFRATVERLAEGVYLCDNETGKLVQANISFCRLLGYTEEEFRGMTPFDFIAGEEKNGIQSVMNHVEAQLAKTGTYELGARRYRRKNNTEVEVDVRVGFVPNGGKGLNSVIVRDISQQRLFEQQLLDYQLELECANSKLREVANKDGLTGIANRAAFNVRMDDEFERSNRYGRPFSLILLDVDHFKSFNDSFGHPAGDEVLRKVARLLAGSARATDFVARYGGEEFAVILPETDRGGAMALAERFRRAVAEHPWDLRQVSISVGVAVKNGAADSIRALLKSSDDALYQSKTMGRNRVHLAVRPVPTACEGV